MNRVIISLAVAAFAMATPIAAMAQQAAGGAAPTTLPAFTQVDSDHNGSVSMSELQVVIPNLSMDQFNSADADKSGGLSETELASIGAAGTSSLSTLPPDTAAGKPTGNK